PAAGIVARFVELVEARQFASAERAVEILGHDSVLLFVERQSPLEQLHFDHQLMNLHAAPLARHCGAGNHVLQSTAATFSTQARKRGTGCSTNGLIEKDADQRAALRRTPCEQGGALCLRTERLVAGADAHIANDLT